MAKSILILITALVITSSAGAQPFGYTPLQIQSLFAEDYRNEQYQQALIYGRWLVDAHPKEMEEYPGNYPAERNFRRMIDIYEYMSTQQEDPTLREAYLDSALQMFDRVFALFTEEEIDVYRWHFNRGRFFQSHSDYIEDAFLQALEDYEIMFNMDPKRATESGGGYYVQMIVQHYARQSDRDKAFAIINEAEPFADEETSDFFDQTRNEMITDPQERIELLTGELEEEPENMELMKELHELYVATGARDKAREIAEKMYEIEPSVANVTRLADKAENEGEYRQAIRYLAEAHEIQQGSARARTSLRIADNYLSLRDLQEARRYARRAANEDPNWGEPQIMIAEIYGEAVSRCAGSDMTRIDKAVYWLVLDYLDRAKQRNSNVTSTVNRLYRTYEPVTPTAEEKFYQNWNTGDKIRIDGSLKECYSWIGEETTVR
ncbi:MAG: hypothetical protein ACQETM_01745 [Bacteroidota bacterium]